MDEFRRRPTPWTNMPMRPSSENTQSESVQSVKPPVAPRPAPSVSQPEPEMTASYNAKPSKRVLRKPPAYIRLIGVALVVLIAAGVIYITSGSSTPIPASILSQITYPVLYPEQLPAGYSVDTSTMNVNSGVLVYAIRGLQNMTVSVSEQAKPSNFDFSQIKGDTQFQTSYGNAVIKVNDTTTTASLVTDHTWVLLNSTSPVATKDIETLLNSFQPLVTK